MKILTEGPVAEHKMRDEPFERVDGVALMEVGMRNYLCCLSQTERGTQRHVQEAGLKGTEGWYGSSSTHDTLCAPAFLLRSCTVPTALNVSG